MKAPVVPAVALILALGLTACETAANEGGVADYDALRKAQQACAAQGGTFKLKSGGDATFIQDYACERK
jgi:hypothetical protein